MLTFLRGVGGPAIFRLYWSPSEGSCVLKTKIQKIQNVVFSLLKNSLNIKKLYFESFGRSDCWLVDHPVSLDKKKYKICARNLRAALHSACFY